jgi:hypothetical protein
MPRMFAAGVIAVSALSFLAPGAAAQTPPAPSGYTFVAQWDIPRAQWGNFTTDFEKNTRPTLEKLAADGTLVSWGVFEAVVHTDGGYTHGTWWSAPGYAGIEKARTELVKVSAASTSLAAATRHRDYLLTSLVSAGKPGSGTGYLSVSSYVVKPGKGRDWQQLWEKNEKPTYDDLLAKGSLGAYSIDIEDYHTENPGLRFVVSVSPSAEADDQAVAAFDAANAKRTPQERAALRLQTDELLEPGTHRDMYARVIRYWRK